MHEELTGIGREEKLRQNPEMVFRKEEDGAFLFDPATGNLKYINANGVNLYELCDGEKTVGEIIDKLAASYPEVGSDQIAADAENYFDGLLAMDFIMRKAAHAAS